MPPDGPPVIDPDSILRASGTALWSWDARTRRMTWGEGSEALCGVEPGAKPPAEEPFFGRIHPDDRDAVLGALAAVRRDEALDESFRVVLPDGSVRWLHARGRRLAGGAAPVVGTLQEILPSFERSNEPARRADSIGAIANPAQTLQSVIDYAPALIRVVSREGTVVLSNDRGQASGLVGKNVLALTPPANRNRLRRLLRRVFEDGETIEFEGEAPGMGWFAGAYAPIVEDGEVVSAVAVSYDVTERHRKETQRRRRDAWFRTFAESAPVLMWHTNAEGFCEYANPAFTRFTGRGVGGHLGLEWIEAIHPDDRHAYVAESLAALQGRCDFQSEARVRRYDGEYRLLRTNGTAIENGAGEFEGHVGFCIDLTEIHRAEDATQDVRIALADALRIETMDQMVAHIAHELHQPLSAISLAAGAALRNLSADRVDPALLRDMMEETQRQALYAGTVLGAARDSIRGELDQLVPLDANELVQGIVPLLEREARRRAVRVELELAAEPPHVGGRSVQLQQVLMNLAQNAFRALDDATGERVLRISTRATADANEVEIRVADSGPGIRPDVLTRIFDTYFTTRPDGLGMGLAICRSIVDGHGGRLLCHSPPEGGAVFRVLLPVVSEPETGSS